MKKNQMKTISNIKKILTGLLTIFILLGGYTYASEPKTEEYSAKIELETDKTTIKQSETVNIKIKVKDIDIEEGINVIQGKLEYDKDVFEKVVNEDIDSKNNWSMIYNDEDTEAEGKFIAINLSAGVKEDQEIAEITLKAKENVDSKNTKIQISELSTTKEEEMVDLEDEEVSIKVKGRFSIKNIFQIWIENIKNVFKRK